MAATIRPCELRPPGGVRRARGPQQHEPLAADEPRGVEVPRPFRLDRAVELDATAEPRGPVRRQQRRGAVERHGDDPLVLAIEELLQRPEPREGQHRVPLALGEQVELRRDVAQRVPLDRPAGQHGADREREREREQRDEQRSPRRAARAATRAHGRMALYPDPRNVRIASGRPSLRRSWATWTSTVRVPPA